MSDFKETVKSGWVGAMTEWAAFIVSLLMLNLMIFQLASCQKEIAKVRAEALRGCTWSALWVEWSCPQKKY